MPRWRSNTLQLAIAAVAIAGCGSASAGPVVEPARRAVVLVVDRWASASVHPNADGDLPPIATAKLAVPALLAGLGPRDVFAVIVLQRAGGYTQGVSCDVLEVPVAHATIFAKVRAQARIAAQRDWIDDTSRPPNDWTPCLPRGIERAERALAGARGHGLILVVSDEERVAEAEGDIVDVARRASADGTAISTIGLDAPVAPMRSIAAAGGGHAYEAHDDAEVATMIARALAN